MSKVYVACPYTDKDPVVREFRFKQVSKFAAELMSQGHLVFSPISHSHQICVEAELPVTFEFWQELDNSFLEWADVMVVYQMPGWKCSKGILEETKIMKFMGKPVEYEEYK